jgi:hypothetical protein
MESHETSQTIEFGFSEASIRKGNILILVLILFLLPFLVIFALYLSHLDIKATLVAVSYTILIFGIITAIEIPLMNRSMRKLKVFVDKDKLIRQCGKRKQILLWTDIARIKTVEKKNGVVAQIKIYPKKPNMAMYLHGFQQMENLAYLIKERTSDSVVHQEKRWKLDWQNPYVVMLVGGVPTMVVMFIVASMGSKAGDVFAVSMGFIVGLGILKFRPMTKHNASIKWVELFFGIALLGLGIYALIYYFLFGKMP